MDSDDSGAVEFEEFLSWFREYGIAIKQREQLKRKKNAKKWFLKTSRRNKLVFDQELENEKGIVLEAKCALSSEVVVKARSEMLLSIAVDEEKKSAVNTYTSSVVSPDTTATAIKPPSLLSSPLLNSLSKNSPLLLTEAGATSPSGTSNQVKSSVINPLEYPEKGQMDRLMNRIMKLAQDLQLYHQQTVQLTKIAIAGQASLENDIQIEKVIADYRVKSAAMKKMMKYDKTNQNFYDSAVSTSRENEEMDSEIKSRTNSGAIGLEEGVGVGMARSMMSSVTSMSSHGTDRDADSFLAGIQNMKSLKNGDPFLKQTMNRDEHVSSPYVKNISEIMNKTHSSVVSNVLSINQLDKSSFAEQQQYQQEGDEESTWHGGPRAPFTGQGNNFDSLIDDEGGEVNDAPLGEQQQQAQLRDPIKEATYNAMEQARLAMEEEMHREVRAYAIGEPVLVRRLGRPRKLSLEETLLKKRKEEANLMKAKQRKAEKRAAESGISVEEALKFEDAQTNPTSSKGSSSSLLPTAADGWEFTWVVMRGIVIGRERVVAKRSSILVNVLVEEEEEGKEDKPQSLVNKTMDKSATSDGIHHNKVKDQSEEHGEEGASATAASAINSEESHISDDVSKMDSVLDDTKTTNSETQDGGTNAMMAWDYKYTIQFPEDANEMHDNDPNISSVHSWQGGFIGDRFNTLNDDEEPSVDGDSVATNEGEVSLNNDNGNDEGVSLASGRVLTAESEQGKDNKDAVNVHSTIGDINKEETSNDDNMAVEGESPRSSPPSHQHANARKSMDDMSYDSVFSLTLDQVDSKLMRRLPREVLAMERRAARAAVARQQVEEAALKASKTCEEIKKYLRKIQALCSRERRGKFVSRLKKLHNSNSTNSNQSSSINAAAGAAAGGKASSVASAAAVGASAPQMFSEYSNLQHEFEDRDNDDAVSHITSGLYTSLQFQDILAENQDFIQCLFDLIKHSLSPSCAKLAKDLVKVNRYSSLVAQEAKECHPTCASSVESWGEGAVEFDDFSNRDQDGNDEGEEEKMHGQSAASSDKHAKQPDFGSSSKGQLKEFLRLPGGFLNKKHIGEGYGPMLAVNSLRVIGQCCFRNRKAADLIARAEGFEDMLRDSLEITRKLIFMEQTRTENKQIDWMLGGAIDAGNKLMKQEEILERKKQYAMRRSYAKSKFSYSKNTANQTSDFGTTKSECKAEEEGEEIEESMHHSAEVDHGTTSENKTSDISSHPEIRPSLDSNNDGFEKKGSDSDSDSEDENSGDQWLNSVIASANKVDVETIALDKNKHELLNKIDNQSSVTSPSNQPPTTSSPFSPFSAVSGASHLSPTLQKQESFIISDSQHQTSEVEGKKENNNDQGNEEEEEEEEERVGFTFESLLEREPKVLLEITRHIFEVIINAADCSWNCHQPILRCLTPFMFAIKSRQGKTLPIAITKHVCMALLALAYNRKSRKALDAMSWILDSVLLLNPKFLVSKLLNSNMYEAKFASILSPEADPRSYAALALSILTIPEKEHDSGNVIDDIDLVRDRDGNEDETLKFPTAAGDASELGKEEGRHSISAAASPSLKNTLSFDNSSIKRKSSFIGSPISINGISAAVFNPPSNDDDNSNQDINETDIMNQISVMKIHPALMTLSKPSSTAILKNVLDLLSLSLSYQTTPSPSSFNYVSTSWKLCSVLSRLCRVPVFRANLMVLGCLPILFKAVTVGTKLINLKNSGAGLIAQSNKKKRQQATYHGDALAFSNGPSDSGDTETDGNNVPILDTLHTSPYLLKKRASFVDRNLLKPEEKASVYLGGAVDANTWSRGEPTTMVATIGWLQRYACEALLNIGQEPHILEEIRDTCNGELYISLKEIATLTPKKADQLSCSMPNEQAKTTAMLLLDMLGEQSPTEPREFAMLTRSECKSSAEVIQFLTIFPNASCLPTPSSEFMNSVNTKGSNQTNKQGKEGEAGDGLKEDESQSKNQLKHTRDSLSFISQSSSASSAHALSPQSRHHSPLPGANPADSEGYSAVSNSPASDDDDSAGPSVLGTSASFSEASLPKRTSFQSVSSSQNNYDTLLSKKMNNQRKLVQHELNQGYGYTWFTYNKAHNKLNDFKEPSEKFLIKERKGEIDSSLACHYLFNMNDLSSRTLYREGLSVYKAWQVRSKAAENLMKSTWFSEFPSPSSSGKSGATTKPSPTSPAISSSKALVHSLACFWLDFHYCIYLHQHEVCSPHRLNLCVDTLELKYLIRRFASRYGMHDLNGQVEELEHDHKLAFERSRRSTNHMVRGSKIMDNKVRSSISGTTSTSDAALFKDNQRKYPPYFETIESRNDQEIDESLGTKEERHKEEEESQGNNEEESEGNNNSLVQEAIALARRYLSGTENSGKINKFPNFNFSVGGEIRGVGENQQEEVTEKCLIKDDMIFEWLCKHLPMEKRKQFFTTKVVIPPLDENNALDKKAILSLKKDKNIVIWGSIKNPIVKQVKQHKSNSLHANGLQKKSHIFENISSGYSNTLPEVIVKVSMRTNGPCLWRVDSVDSYFARARGDGRSDARLIDAINRGLVKKPSDKKADHKRLSALVAGGGTSASSSSFSFSGRPFISGSGLRSSVLASHATREDDGDDNDGDDWRVERVSMEKFVRYMAYAEKEATLNGLDYLQTSDGAKALIKTAKVVKKEGSAAIENFLIDCYGGSGSLNKGDSGGGGGESSQGKHAHFVGVLNDEKADYEDQNEAVVVGGSEYQNMNRYKLFNSFDYRKLEDKQVSYFYDETAEKLKLEREEKLKRETPIDTSILSFSSMKYLFYPKKVIHLFKTQDSKLNSMLKDKLKRKKLFETRCLMVWTAFCVEEKKKNIKKKNLFYLKESLDKLNNFKQETNNTKRKSWSFSNVGGGGGDRFAARDSISSAFVNPTLYTPPSRPDSGSWSESSKTTLTSTTQWWKRHSTSLQPASEGSDGSGVVVGLDKLEFPGFLKRMCQIVPDSSADYAALVAAQSFDLMPCSNELIYFNSFLTWYYSAITNLSFANLNKKGGKSYTSSLLMPSSSSLNYLNQLSYWNTATNSKRFKLLSSDRIMVLRRRRARLEIRRHFEVAENLKDFVERCKNWEE